MNVNRKRRMAIKGLSTLAVLPAAAALAKRGQGAGQGAGQPNILFILADDLGYADLSVYGQTDFRTPTWTAWRPRACA
jgi:hypothetical protein